MKQLLRIKSSDRNEAFILIIEKISPLTISEKIVLLAVAEQGKWIVRPGDKKNSDQQLIEDTSLVDKAVQIWSAKVRVSITDGQIHNEINFHSVLYRLAQFNGSYTEVYAAVSKICESNEGLIKFLSAFDPFKQNPDHFHLERVSLIEDANQMIEKIENSTVKNEYQWFIDLLNSENIIQGIKEQASRLKDVKVCVSSDS